MCSNSAANAWNDRMDMSGFVHGGIINITAGAGIAINTTTDGATPEYPQIIATGEIQGLQYVMTDSTLTGNGKPGNELHVVDNIPIKSIVPNSPNVHITMEDTTAKIAVDAGTSPGGYWQSVANDTISTLDGINDIEVEGCYTQISARWGNPQK